MMKKYFMLLIVSVFVGVGNSFPQIFQLYLRCDQRKEVKQKLTTLDVVDLMEQMAKELPWLSRCVNEIDAANIGVQHSLKKVLENASRPLSIEVGDIPLEVAIPLPTRSRSRSRRRLSTQER